MKGTNLRSAARYLPRAPRYIFRPGDQRLMRFADMQTRGEATRATVRDVSVSGLSFVVKADFAPNEGEILKIEFGLPGRDQIAWFASVVRVENHTEWDPDFGDRSRTIIAVRFRQLPVAISKAIRRSLRGRIHDQGGAPLEALPPIPLSHKRALYVLAVALFAALIVLALPPNLWIAPFKTLFR